MVLLLVLNLPHLARNIFFLVASLLLGSVVLLLLDLTNVLLILLCPLSHLSSFLYISLYLSMLQLILLNTISKERFIFKFGGCLMFVAIQKNL